MLLARCEAINGSTDLVFRRGHRALRDGNCRHAHSAPAPLQIDALPAYWLGARPHGIDAFHIHIVSDAAMVEQITKAIILISLFPAGLKMRLPITSRLWFLSLRLAFLSMLITVALIALVGIFPFGLPTGVAILMGGILAPTGPVLASDVQVDNAYQLGALRFGLTSEAGLNDGSAFPFVLLGFFYVQSLTRSRTSTVIFASASRSRCPFNISC